MAEPKSEEVLSLMAEKFRVLGNATRLAVIQALMGENEKNVTEIVEATGQPTANVSKHLRQLFAAGVVGRRKEGLQVFYRVTDPLIDKLCHLVCESIATDVAEMINTRKKKR